MIEEIFDEKELAFITQIENYEGQWVAFVDYGGDDEIIVSSGSSIREARREAESKGFTEVTFFKVPPSNKVFIP
jgi:hypothetical protein